MPVEIGPSPVVPMPGQLALPFPELPDQGDELGAGPMSPDSTEGRAGSDPNDLANHPIRAISATHASRRTSSYRATTPLHKGSCLRSMK